MKKHDILPRTDLDRERLRQGERKNIHEGKGGIDGDFKERVTKDTSKGMLLK